MQERADRHFAEMDSIAESLPEPIDEDEEDEGEDE
jgi:hypothetical protein